MGDPFERDVLFSLGQDFSTDVRFPGNLIVAQKTLKYAPIRKRKFIKIDRDRSLFFHGNTEVFQFLWQCIMDVFCDARPLLRVCDNLCRVIRRRADKEEFPVVSLPIGGDDCLPKVCTAC